MQRKSFTLPWEKKWITQLIKLYKKINTCSAEWFFFRYKKIPKKRVKSGSSLQYSVYIFVGNVGCFWKINLKTIFLKSYHEELSSKAWPMWKYHILKNVFFWKSLINYYTFALLTAEFFTFGRSWNLSTNLS